MAQRRNLPAGYENPFEQVGLDKQLVDSLLQSDAQAIGLALGGLRRAVTKALHPDRVGGQESEYLTKFLQATGHILSLPESEQRILAAAYAKRSVRRTQAQKVEYTSKDLHDGELLRSIGDMLIDSHESIPSSHGLTMVVRPVNYSSEKPANTPKDESKGYEWYPPALSRTFMIQVDEQGAVHTQAMMQLSFAKMFAKESGKRLSNVEHKEKMLNISQQIDSLVSPVLLPSVRSASGRTIVIHKQASGIVLYGENLGNKIWQFTGENDLPLVDGVYIFDAENGTLADTYYAFDASATLAPSSLLVAGTLDYDYVQTERSTIYDRSQPDFYLPLLPGRKINNESIVGFPIRPEMLKAAQKSYSPKIINNKTLLAINANEEFVLLGNTVVSYR